MMVFSVYQIKGELRGTTIVPFVEKQNLGFLKKSGMSGEVTMRGLCIYPFPLHLIASKSADAQHFFTIYIK